MITFITLHGPDGTPIYIQHTSVVALEETHSERTMISLTNGSAFHVRESAKQIVEAMDKACK